MTVSICLEAREILAQMALSGAVLRDEANSPYAVLESPDGASQAVSARLAPSIVGTLASQGLIFVLDHERGDGAPYRVSRAGRRLLQAEQPAAVLVQQTLL